MVQALYEKSHQHKAVWSDRTSSESNYSASRYLDQSHVYRSSKMAGMCEVCKNLDPNDAMYGKMWTTGPVFENNYLPVVIITESEGKGCLYCSLLIQVIDEFVPNWRPMREKISFRVTAPDRRPIEVTIMEAPQPDAEFLELANVHLSAPECKINFIRLQWPFKEGIPKRK